MKPIDWSIFDKDPESTCYCKCGNVYRSHSKLISENSSILIVTRKPCPLCNKNTNNCYRIASDPETFSIKKEG